MVLEGREEGFANMVDDDRRVTNDDSDITDDADFKIDEGASREEQTSQEVGHAASVPIQSQHSNPRQGPKLVGA